MHYLSFRFCLRIVYVLLSCFRLQYCAAGERWPSGSGARQISQQVTPYATHPHGDRGLQVCTGQSVCFRKSPISAEENSGVSVLQW